MNVFYSWQNDTSSKLNRYFIRRCLEKSITQINDKASIEDTIRLDHDTKGIPGLPNIVETILNKIDNCNVFIADITFVAKNEHKLFPNSNVLIELGYALKSIGDTKIICIMNSVFGQPKDGLPFDLAHKRWPITYHLSEEASKDEIKSIEAGLISSFKETITDIIRYKNHKKANLKVKDAPAFDLEFHKEVFKYANSADGPMLSKAEAKEFADKWISSFSKEDLSRFKEVFEYANSVNGLMKGKADSFVYAMKYFDKT
jgi:hypothetical protein